MSNFKRVTPKTLNAVVLRTLDTIKDDREAQQAFCTLLNTFLDDMLSEDAFGTEGQCDPRGDHRA